MAARKLGNFASSPRPEETVKIFNRRLSCFAPSPSAKETMLTPEKLEVFELWHQCGVNIDRKTFLQIWRLSEFGIPPKSIVSFLNEISKYYRGKPLLRQQTV